MTRSLLFLLTSLSLACSATSRETTPADAVLLGAGEHTYVWVDDWLQVPGGGELGNTHGEIVVDDGGLIHLSADVGQAVMTFRADGSFVSAWGEEFANGVHGMVLGPADEGVGQVLYFVHFNRHEFVKATLDGEVLWRRGAPMSSGLYESEDQFRPTSIAVAPDGGIYVADGYGRHWVHRYDADGRYLASFGGPGSEPGQLSTPHGLLVDTRSESPRLLVADRENHRLSIFDLDGNFHSLVEGMLRRPCKIQQRGEFLVIPDLAGRVTILDGDNQLVTHLGDNPDESLRAVNGVPRESWVDGLFLAPHAAAWDAQGDLYVMDWNFLGRVNKLRHVPSQSSR
ncbi:MAG: hypothetical protein ACI9EF_003353 [Pseudohongiellaceae bacterium]|jgi:hypothetical protein